MGFVVSSVSSTSNTISFQDSLKEATLKFIFSSPKYEEDAWKKLNEIVEPVSMPKMIGGSNRYV